jgi:hypothetical protein
VGELKGGEHFTTAGDATVLKVLVGKTADQLERGIGFEKGRLRKGWWLLTIIGRPDPNDFLMSGNTAYSGGQLDAKAYNEKFNPLPVVGHFDTRARFLRPNYDENKKRLLDLLTIDGGEGRIAKIHSAIRHDPRKPANQQYPAGTGLFQITFTKQQKWLVKGFVGPGEVLVAASPE